MKPITIRALHGMPRTGKDSAALFAVQRYGYRHLKFATHLYREVSEAFDVAVSDLESDDWKRRGQPALMLDHCRDAAFVEVARPHFKVGELPTSRRLLQLWGTEYRRAQNNFYWIGKLEEDMNEVRMREGVQRIVISDLRELHEAEWVNLQVLRGVAVSISVIEIVKPDAGAVDIGNGRTHTSDARLPDRYIDDTVVNDGTLSALYGRMDKHFNPAYVGQHMEW